MGVTSMMSLRRNPEAVLDTRLATAGCVSEGIGQDPE